VHADDEVHDTLFRKANWAPAGVGVGWMLQLVPFHPSARVPAFDAPTAVQPEDVGQATLARKPPPCAGLGVGWMLQRVPFHRSARVVPSALPPTAVHAEGEVHDTLFRAPPPAGVGVG